MYIQPVYSISFVVITLLLSYFFVKRLQKKGCVLFAYVTVVIFCINLFAVFSWAFMVDSGKDLYKVVKGGKTYTGVVVSTKEEEHHDSGHGNTKMYKPTVEFTTASGKVVTKELDFASSRIAIGDTYQVNYSDENSEVITLGFTMILKIVASFIFCFIFTFLIAGAIRFALGWSMEGYYTLISKIGFMFFLPFLMIGFDALLIYALFYGNEVPVWISVFLVFFILVLTLGIWGYLKNIFSKGAPVMHRVGPNRWQGGWDNNEDEDEELEDFNDEYDEDFDDEENSPKLKRDTDLEKL